MQTNKGKSHNVCINIVIKYEIITNNGLQLLDATKTIFPDIEKENCNC